jgi:hypothetical protein
MWALVLGRGGFEPPKALGQLIYSQSRLTASVSARPRDFTDNRPMGTRRWILWQGLVTPSMERFIVGASGGGFELSGLILQSHEESPYVVRYAIEVDAAWRTRKVEVGLEDGGERRLSLRVDAEGNWSHDGQRLERPGCGFPPWRSNEWSKAIGASRNAATAIDLVASPLTSRLTTTAWSSSTASTGRPSPQAANSVSAISSIGCAARGPTAPRTPPLPPAEALVVPSYFSMSDHACAADEHALSVWNGALGAFRNEGNAQDDDGDRWGR